MSSSKILRNTYAKIDLNLLVSNLRVLRGMTEEAEFFCPMVKANAYGHGAVEVARALIKNGVENLGVALVEEGMALRQAGIRTANIFVFGSIHTDSAAEAMIENQLTPVVSSWEELTVIERRLPTRARQSIHLKFDTGMHRLGFPLGEGLRLKAHFAQSQKLNLTGICSHLTDGEDLADDQGRSQTQLRRFRHLLGEFGNVDQVHALNSSALLARQCGGIELAKGLGARPGIALYGIKPELVGVDDPGQKKWASINLGPVLQLCSEVVMYHRLEAGERVSYGGCWQAERPSIVATLAIGYADGYRRSLTNRGEVLFRGQRVPVIGTVCMDYILADVTDVVSEIAVCGDPVVIVGHQGTEFIGADEVAKTADTISYEIFTGLSLRVPRNYVPVSNESSGL